MIPATKLEFLKNKIRKDCPKCNGLSCSECQKKISRMLRYAEANIPMDYWSLPITTFNGDPKFKETISERIKNIDDMYGKGESLGFVGNLGTGKTFAASCILKKALVSGYECFYVNMVDVIDSVSKGDAEFYQRITTTDFLCIDEFDARYVYPSEKAEQLFGQTMERVLRERFQNQMPTIICSNTAELKSVLHGDFSRAIDSLFAKYLKIYYIAGKDFRKTVKES